MWMSDRFDHSVHVVCMKMIAVMILLQWGYVSKKCPGYNLNILSLNNKRPFL